MRSENSPRRLGWMTAVVVGLVGLMGTGCGPKTVRILLTDAPLDGATEVNITLTGLKIFEAGRGSDPAEPGPGGRGGPATVVFDEVKTFNLLALRNGATALLGEVPVSGRIAHMRLELAGDAQVVYQDGTVRKAFVPSGAQTGIKLAGSFDPADTELLLDFDAAQSIVEAGDRSLRLVPSIRIYSRGQQVGGVDAG